MFKLLPDYRSYESICRAENVSLMKRINLKLVLPVTPVTGFFSQLQSWCGFPACFLLIYIDSVIILSLSNISHLHFIVLSEKAATEMTRQN